ncbi:sugar diacid utilization regulator [Paenibacillus albiflavus]|uniref:Sugar diacid utilization regulator n=1 Tax=Paenibacillus albiflavus TaxID=2545760 RepID=A0A4R4EF30_9BACL|nr:sugar diacid recognition domain-containing protein [Paenibacillus albiflavus]TCZ78147.1 sugar diacid utilization regulator [Paenibacillus albiflavus]
MYELTHNQAQTIVDRMMMDIPYNINIMDHTGRIIGSGNKRRIGTLHHGACKAIRQGQTVEIHKDEELVKKGINLPIEWNGHIIGVVGISGEVTEMRPFGNILKSAVILLIEQNIALEKANLKNNLKQEFFSLLIDSDTTYTKELISQALTYGIELTKSSQIIYVESSSEIAEDMMKSLPSFRMSNYSLCIVVQETDKIEALQQTIANQYPNAFISISKMNDTVSEGMLQAKLAMRVLKGVYFDVKAISYSQCEFIADILKLHKNDTKAERLIHSLEKDDELIKTLQVYLSCNLNANVSADRLMIHRNTLNYRLQKIHSITGKDPKHILDLVELICMLIKRIK